MDGGDQPEHDRPPGPSRRGQGSFGARLRRLRERAGLSQEHLAERAGLDVKTVAALERDRRRRPHPHTLAALVRALDLTPAERGGLQALAEQLGAGPQPPALPPDVPLGDARPTVSLPIPPTPLLGREAEVAAAQALLDPSDGATRLLVLVGPGGVGKTRLALAVAGELVDRYADGVVFVDLAPLRDHRLVAATIAHALELREAGGRSARALLLEHLRQRRVLLVLDNCEHLLEAAPLLAELLQACSCLALLVTSRTALRLRAEQRFAVAPLPTPTADAGLSVAAIAASPAVRLFVERAQAIVPDFRLEASNAHAVAAICRHLEGLPLAIELAAARAGLLQPEALLRRLERRLPLLTGGPADLPARQQALRQALAWSHNLLGPAEQVLFRRLAVFAGGWTPEAAEAVCTDAIVPAHELLDQLQVLMDSSLVRRLDDSRFSMLETVREYAQEQLAASGETETSCARHRDWCVALVEHVAPEQLEPSQVTRLDCEQDNLRAALRWCITRGQVEAGLRMGIGCWPLWYMRGRYGEGRAWLSELLQLTDDRIAPALRGRALAYAGHLAYCEGDAAPAEQLLGQALAVAEQAADRPTAGACTHFLGNLARLRGDLPTAESCYERALALTRLEHSRAWELRALVMLGVVHYERGDLVGADRCAREVLATCAAEVVPPLRPRAWALAVRSRLAALAHDRTSGNALEAESLRLFETLDDPQGLAFAHLLAADTALDHSKSRDAAQHLAAVLTVARETHDQLALVRGLEGVARLLAPTQPQHALSLVAAAGTLRQTLGLQLAPVDRVHLESWVPGAHAAIGSAPDQVQANVPANPGAAALADALAACDATTRRPTLAPA